MVLLNDTLNTMPVAPFNNYISNLWLQVLYILLLDNYQQYNNLPLHGDYYESFNSK